MNYLPAIALMAHDVHGPEGASDSVAEAGNSVPVSFLVDIVDALRSRGYRFVGLAEFLDSREAGGVALLTFDDGYARLRTWALPALQSLKVPALFFIMTETLNSPDCFPIWAYALRDVLEEVPSEMRTRLETNQDVHDLVLELGVSSLQEVLALPSRELYSNLFPRFSYERLDHLRSVVEGLGLLPRLTLSAEAILELNESELVEFGAHSVAHRNLVQVPPKEARRQVVESIQSVAALTGANPRDIAFAYPHGAVSPAARAAVEEVGGVGFTVAERAMLGADRLSQLPRLTLDETVLQRSAQPPKYKSLLEERIRIRLAPAREHARHLKNRLRGPRTHRLDGSR